MKMKPAIHCGRVSHPYSVVSQWINVKLVVRLKCSVEGSGHSRGKNLFITAELGKQI